MNKILNTVPVFTIHLDSPILCVPKKDTNQVYPSCNTSNHIIDNSIPNIAATTSVTATASEAIHSGKFIQ